MRYYRCILIMLLAILLATSITAQDDRPGGADPLAMVNSVETVVVPGAPISIIVAGTLPNGCSEIGEPEQTIDGETISLRLPVISTAERLTPCTDDTPPFEIGLELMMDDLTPGTYTISVNGVDAEPLEITTAMLDLSTTDAQSASCPQADDDTEAYTNEADSYCLLYPAGYTVTPPEETPDGALMISAPELVEDTEIHLRISAEPVNGRGLIAVATELEARNMAEDMDFEPTMIAGTLSFITLDDTSIGLTERFGVLIYRETLYIFAMPVVDDALTEANAESETLWSTVLDSFTIMLAQGEPTTQTLDNFRLEITYLDSWDFIEQPGLYALNIPGLPDATSPYLIGFGFLGGVTPDEDRAALIEQAQVTYAQIGVDDLTVIDDPLLELAAIEITTLAGSGAVCRLALIPTETLVLTVIISSDVCEDGEIINEAVLDVLASVRFVE